MSEQSARLAAAWDEAAAGYEGYFVPRFWPWNQAALDAFSSLEVPPGRLLVPCCGTGQELVALASLLPGREYLGIDLSAGMIALAQSRCAGVAGARAVVGDASELRGYGPAAGLLSCFGLQQMPDPAAALAAWGRALLPGGQLAVLYWPPDARDGGPFSMIRAMLVARGLRNASHWEEALRPALEGVGLHLQEERALSFEMRHESAASFWEALTQVGPMRALAREQPAALLQELRHEFCGALPRGELRHAPVARLLLARRP